MGHNPSEGSSASLSWGPKYRELHKRAIQEWRRILKPGGCVILNMSDHLATKGGVQRRVPVSDWWVVAMIGAGFRLVRAVEVDTPRFSRGRNGAARVSGEMVFKFVAPSAREGVLL